MVKFSELCKLLEQRSPSGLHRSAGAFQLTSSEPGRFVEDLESRKLFNADLAVESGDSFAPLSFYVPGESIVVPFSVRNNGADPFTGRASVTAQLSSADNPDGTGLPEFTTTVTLTAVAPDGTVNGTVSILVSSDFDPAAYSISLVVVPRNSAGVELEDEWSADNQVDVEQDVNVLYVAGNYGGRTGVTLRTEDLDGTDFTISVTGGGFAEVEERDTGIWVVVNGVANIAAKDQPAQTLSIAYLADTDPESNDTINFDAAGFSITSGELLRLAAINAPNLSLRDVQLSAQPSQMPATPVAVTLRDISDLGPEGASSAGFFSQRPLGVVSVRDVSGTFDAISSGNLTLRDITGEVRIGGSTGAVSLRNITDGVFDVGRVVTSFVAQDLLNAVVTINSDGVANRTSVPFTVRDVTQSELELNLQISTFSARRWLESTDKAPIVENYLAARAIASFTVGPAPTTALPTSGNFNADVFVVGGISRPTQLGTVNIAGTLAGSFFVNGSAGAFTARTVATGAYHSGLGWAPALAASGTVLSFTSTDIQSGAIWANAVRNATLTVASSDREFEIAAGFRVAPDSFLLFDADSVLSAASFRSGTIGSLNLTLRPGVDGFTGRFAAGINAKDALRDKTGVMDFPAAGSELTAVQAGTVSRIGSISVTGVVTSTTISNSLQFAAITFPAARFSYGTGTTAVNVTIPGFTGTPTPGAIAVTPASTFFRVGRAV